MFLIQKNIDKVLFWKISRTDRANGLGTTIAEELELATIELENKLSQWKRSGYNRSMIPAHALIIKTIAGGQSKNIWVAGGDLKELAELKTPNLGREYAKKLTEVCNRIESLPIPTIAVIDGHAIGGGWEFAISTDIRIGTTKTKFHFKQLEVGLATGYGSCLRISEIVGKQKALQLLLTGEVVDCHQSLQLGLLHFLETSGDSAHRLALTFADRFKNLEPKAIAHQKAMFQNLVLEDHKISQLKELDLFEELWLNDSHKNFLEKFTNK